MERFSINLFYLSSSILWFMECLVFFLPGAPADPAPPRPVYIDDTSNSTTAIPFPVPGPIALQQQPRERKKGDSVCEKDTAIRQKVPPQLHTLPLQVQSPSGYGVHQYRIWGFLCLRIHRFPRSLRPCTGGGFQLTWYLW